MNWYSQTASRHAACDSIERIYDEVNALGGVVSVGDAAGAEYCKALDDVLAIVERALERARAEAAPR